MHDTFEPLASRNIRKHNGAHLGTVEGSISGEDTGAEGRCDGLDGCPMRAGQFAGDTVGIDDSSTKLQEEPCDCALPAADPTRQADSNGSRTHE
jgi:hypothetical protein